MFPYIEQNQLAPYYEAEMRRYGRQNIERGYTGIGYWFSGYPTYISAMQGTSGITTAAPPQGDQAQPDADSKMAGAILEAGADTSGVNSGASGTAAS